MARTEGERGVSVIEAMRRDRDDRARFRVRLWPVLIHLWIASVFLMFVVIRVLGSNTARHIFHSLVAH